MIIFKTGNVILHKFHKSSARLKGEFRFSEEDHKDAPREGLGLFKTSGESLDNFLLFF